MGRLTTEQRLERAKQIKAKAEAEIRAASAKMREADRRLDTRRKILVGAAFMKRAMERQDYARELQSLISDMSDQDRKLFEEFSAKETTGVGHNKK